MAVSIQEFPALGRAGRPSKYPWKKWFNGEVWVLIQDEDFDQEVRAFRSGIYTTAQRHGKTVRTQTLEAGTIVDTGSGIMELEADALVIQAEDVAQ